MKFTRQFQPTEFVRSTVNRISKTIPNLTVPIDKIVERYRMGNTYGVPTFNIAYSSDAPDFSENEHIGLDYSDPLTSIHALRDYGRLKSQEAKEILAANEVAASKEDKT